MRGGVQVKEALGFVTLLWNHPVLTGLLLLTFTPPFFPLLVYFSPLLMSTALCVVALVSVGSQMEKIKAEGGPGQQLETHLGRTHGISTWAPPRDRTRSDPNSRAYGGESNNRHRHLYANNIHVVPAPPLWTTARENNNSTVQLRPVENPDPPSSAAAESEEDWWDKWVKDYESRPGWGEQEDQQAFRTPAAIPTSIAPPPPTIPTFTHKEEAPLKPEIREENRPVAPIVAAPVTIPVARAPVAVPVAVTVVTNRQETASRSVPPPPTTSTSRTHEEVVASVKVTDFKPHISTLAPIRTGREATRDRQGDRVGKTPQEILGAPAKVEVQVPEERVSDVQALQSIEKLLHMEMSGSRNVAPNSMPSQATSPGLTTSKGIAVEASEKNRNKIAVDIAGETPLLRHLKTSRSEKHARNNSAFSPLQQKPSRGGIMSEKILPPPQFSPWLLHSLQALPPKGLSPRPLPNLSTVPLGNPVEKIPQWVYDGIPKERAEKQAMKAETVEEKQVRQFEQNVKVLSYTRRRTHARRPAPIQVDAVTLQAFKSSPTTSSLENSTEDSSRRSSTSPGVEAYDSLPTRNSDDLAAHAAGDSHGASVATSTERALPTPRASSAAPSPRMSPSKPGGASVAAAAAAPSPPKLSVAMAHTPPRASRASSPPQAPIVASPRPSPAPQQASIAASPRPSPSPLRASIAASPLPSPAPQQASIAASPRPSPAPQQAPSAASPRPSPAPQQAPIAASPRPSPALQQAPIEAIAASTHPSPSPQQAPIAASPRPSPPPQQASVPASTRGASAPQPAPIAASARPQPSPPKAPISASPRRSSRASSPSIGSTPWPASIATPSPQKPTPSPSRRPSVPSSPSLQHPRRRRQHSFSKVAIPSPILIEASSYYDTPAAEKEDSGTEDYIPIEEVRVEDNPREEGDGALHWGRNSHSSRRSSNSRRRLEPRHVVTSEDADMFCVKKSMSVRNGQTVKFVDSSSTSDDERESVTPRAFRRSMGRTSKPLVWRSRSVQARDDSD